VIKPLTHLSDKIQLRKATQRDSVLTMKRRTRKQFSWLYYDTNKHFSIEEGVFPRRSGNFISIQRKLYIDITQTFDRRIGNVSIWKCK